MLSLMASLYLLTTVQTYRAQVPSAPPRGGKQYTLSFRKRNGKVKKAVVAISNLSLSDLTNLEALDLIPTHPGPDDKQVLLDTLHRAGIQYVDDAVVDLLPTWTEISNLYGSDTVLVGLDRCEAYRSRVPPNERQVGVAGLFNTGTTALATYLQANVHQLAVDEKHPYEVPWGKHRMLSLRHNFTDSERAANVLPIVVVRDPFSWMQSMCRAPYMTSWNRTSAHCPNLVQSNGSAVPVRLKAQNVEFASLLHLWMEWYREYLESKEPRLIVRSEDLTWRPHIVVDAVRACGGWKPVEEDFVYLVGASKWFHAYVKPQSNMISGMIQHGRGQHRIRNMTTQDMALAKRTLQSSDASEMMKTLHYRVP